MGLFEDYAFLDRQKKTFLVGQVFRMTYKGKEFRRPVPLTDARSPQIVVHVLLYKLNNVANPCSFSKSINTKIIKHSDIISAVYLTLEDSSEHFIMNRDAFIKIQIAVEQLCPQRQQSLIEGLGSLQRRPQNSADDGRRTVVVEPLATPGTSSGSRRSTRKRTVVVHEFS